MNRHPESEKDKIVSDIDFETIGEEQDIPQHKSYLQDVRDFVAPKDKLEKEAEQR